MDVVDPADEQSEGEIEGEEDEQESKDEFDDLGVEVEESDNDFSF